MFNYNREKTVHKKIVHKNQIKTKENIEVDAEGKLDLDDKSSGTLDEYNLENKIKN